MDIYLIAIGGTGMAPLACLLQDQGHRVRGTDGPLYPPMSDLLADAGIRPLVGFDPRHLDPAPDLVVVGNAVHRDNVEAREAERLQLSLISMPQALSQFFLDGRRPLVVAGTHGKTTTSSMAAWVLSECGADPGYLIGGAPIGLAGSFRCGGGARFVVEGDEYNAAYFDRGPKFLHYRPQTVILTSVEYDHVDLYLDPESFRAAFAKLIALLPADGRLIACHDEPEVRHLVADAACPVTFYSADPNSAAEVKPASGLVSGPSGTELEIHERGARQRIALGLSGSHNVANALAVWCALRADGIAGSVIAEALGRFRGVRRRLEEVGRSRDIVIVDDFAHHPTEVARSIEGLRARFPERRLWVLFEPRSLTAGRALFFDRYLEALAGADRVLLAPVFHAGRLALEDRLDTGALAVALERRGVAAVAFDRVEELFLTALNEARAGDVLATMSSGAFEDLPRRLASGLAAAGPSTT